MSKLSGFAAFIKKKISDKKKTENREKDPTSTWTGASKTQKEGYKRLTEANRKRREKKKAEEAFYKKQAEKLK